MTEPSTTNMMLHELRNQYRARIDYLQTQIAKQNQEIVELNKLLDEIAMGREYDC